MDSITRVSEEGTVSTLSRTIATPFVRILRSGNVAYAGDTAIVVAEGSGYLSVLVIPRLSPNDRKLNVGSARVPQTLFDPRNATGAIGAFKGKTAVEARIQEATLKPVKQKNGHWKFLRLEYVNGLQLLKLSPGGVVANAVPTPHERRLFLDAHMASLTVATPERAKLTAAASQLSHIVVEPLAEGYRVKIKAGSMGGHSGTVLSGDETSALVNIAETGESSLFPLAELERMFVIGDNVRVRTGDYTGIEGIVVAVNQTGLVISWGGQITAPNELRHEVLFTFICNIQSC